MKKPNKICESDAVGIKQALEDAIYQEVSNRMWKSTNDYIEKLKNEMDGIIHNAVKDYMNRFVVVCKQNKIEITYKK